MIEIEAARAQLDRELAEIKAEFDALIPDESTRSTSTPKAQSKAPTNGRSAAVAATDAVPLMADVLEDYLAANPGIHEAKNIATAVAANPDTVRSTLSKLFTDERINRPDRGKYCAIPGVTGKRPPSGGRH